MNKYVKYINYVVKHKYYVMIESFKLGIPLRGILHDMSKFRPSEFFIYAEYFYGEKRPVRLNNRPSVLNKYYNTIKTQDDLDREFNIAWLKHQHRNKHHWQHWVLKNDSGTVECLDIPDKYIKEMVADWVGVSRVLNPNAENHYLETLKFYNKNKSNIRMSEKSRKRLIEIINNGLFGCYLDYKTYDV